MNDGKALPPRPDDQSAAGDGCAGAPDPFATVRTRLLCLAEPAMRAHVLGELLHKMEPEEVVAMLRTAVSGTSRGDQGADHLLAAFAEIIESIDPRGGPFYDRMAAAYGTAVELGVPEVCRLFTRPPPVRALSQEEMAEWDTELAQLTLGARRSLAKTLRRTILERLLKDPAPEVVRTLLTNPRVAEADIVALAARRPNTAPVLREIHRCPRWKGSYRVRLALVRNPYTPTDIAIHIVTSLAAQDLRTVVNDVHLHDYVREAAKARLGR